MPTVTLVLGGARSGKSTLAEAMISRALETGCEGAVYIATAEPGDREMRERIERHKARRDRRWRTVEEPLELPDAVSRNAIAGTAVLIDCLTLWLSNLMAAGRDDGEATQALLAALSPASGPVVLVSNEVGLGIVPENALARSFRDRAGLLNQAVAAAADRVVFVVAGLPITIKDRAWST
ncbi:MAG: bifunctional adenosylcobinamide kinase/adenosylcobinamide-phosphate guanylyltransferase [Alphaproteobacteria bacterium]